MKNNLKIEGVEAVENLCKVAERLGYRGWLQKLPLRNGAFATSLLNMLEDNPGLIEVMYQWIEKNYVIVLDTEDSLVNENYSSSSANTAKHEEY